MLKLCSACGLKCDFKFNVIKSCYGCIGMLHVNSFPDFVIDNLRLPWVNKLKYLSITFHVGKKLEINCNE